MHKTLEDFYYGNITPGEQQMAPNSELERAVDRVARYESQLTEQLDESGQTILTKLIRSQHDIDSITGLENFILGFRLGVRMMAKCLDDNDGDIREVSDHGKKACKWRGQSPQTKRWSLGGPLHSGPRPGDRQAHLQEELRRRPKKN